MKTALETLLKERARGFQSRELPSPESVEEGGLDQPICLSQGKAARGAIPAQRRAKSHTTLE